jgi:hypothetical protein
LSRTLAELGASRPFDFPLPLSEFRAYAQECLACTSNEAVATSAVIGDAAAIVDAVDVAATAHRFRDYQLEAIDLCTRETRCAAYVALPTGCGKSLVMAHVAARLGLRVVVLVPLVVLLEQFLDVLATLGCAGTEVTAVGGGLTTTCADVETARVVVCVYNSAHKLNLASFDRVLIDEAHFVRVPAIYADLTDTDEESDELEENDESVDGSVDPSPTSAGSFASSRDKSGYAAVRAATTLASARLFSATLDVPDGAERCTRSLREMIAAGCLCDYTLNVPVFDVGAGSADLARHLVREYRSIIVFCATRAEGGSFCAAMNELGPCARYIDCETPRGERRAIIAAFKTGELAFIVNVRVLSVGFDAPITKGVCFVSMPASKTHIVQVIGRCLRLHPDKRIAHVILPIVAGTHDEDKRARDFMRVLALNDTRLAQALRAGGGGYVAVCRVVTLDESDETDGTGGRPDSSETASELLYTAVYDSMGSAVGDPWSTRYDELVAYYEASGHIPPRSTPGGLGVWVKHQRERPMSSDRKARLDALEWWVWSVLATPVLVDWDARFDELVAFYEANGRMPLFATPRLGRWVDNQRQSRATMAPERKARLDALEWWAWDPLGDAWSTQFDELVAFYEANGRMPLFATPRLGSWVDLQRQSRATMAPERKARLDALEWWVWDPLGDAWSTQFDELVAFYEANGTIPGRSTPRLGVWVDSQRSRRATMDAERKARLDGLPWWVWSLRATPVVVDWYTQFDELVAFYDANGRMPPQSTPRLGQWVSGQRQTRGTMAPERKARLEALEWWIWNTRGDAWSTQFDELVAYYAANGRIPPFATPRLGPWVDTQRQRRATMAPERKARLDALGWWVWRVRGGALALTD